MSDILNKTIVLVPNRNWRSINIRKPRNALCQMATNVATTPDIAFDETSESTPLDAPHWESERWNPAETQIQQRSLAVGEFYFKSFQLLMPMTGSAKAKVSSHCGVSANRKHS